MLLIPGIIASSKLGAVGDFESIDTVTVGAGGASSVTFTSIPSTYQHLQIRCIHNNDDGVGWATVYLNNDTTAANYKSHELRGDGSSVSSSAPGNITYGYMFALSQTVQFTASVIDILDYRSTNKNKTMRSLTGYDANGSGYMQLTSGLWLNSASAVTSVSLKIDLGSANFKQYSHFALYGIRG